MLKVCACLWVHDTHTCGSMIPIIFKEHIWGCLQKGERDPEARGMGVFGVAEGLKAKAEQADTQ